MFQRRRQYECRCHMNKWCVMVCGCWCHKRCEDNHDDNKLYEEDELAACSKCNIVVHVLKGRR